MNLWLILQSIFIDTATKREQIHNLFLKEN
ncbi:hypothetical protein N204_03365 [Helicobacter pylori UM085]|nr:hypothetical protein N204_03365 [Helicobacter pylori UM085]